MTYWLFIAHSQIHSLLFRQHDFQCLWCWSDCTCKFFTEARSYGSRISENYAAMRVTALCFARGRKRKSKVKLRMWFAILRIILICEKENILFAEPFRYSSGAWVAMVLDARKNMQALAFRTCRTRNGGNPNSIHDWIAIDVHKQLDKPHSKYHNFLPTWNTGHGPSEKGAFYERKPLLD